MMQKLANLSIEIRRAVETRYLEGDNIPYIIAQVIQFRREHDGELTRKIGEHKELSTISRVQFEFYMDNSFFYT